MPLIPLIAAVFVTGVLCVLITGMAIDSFTPDEPQHLPEGEETFREREAKGLLTREKR